LSARGKADSYGYIVDKTYTIDRVEHRVDIPDLPAGLEGLRILQFGDLHAPKSLDFIRQANAMLRQAEPDLLVSTGDILDHAHWLSVARRQLPVLLEGLRPPLGFYACLGNHDRLGIIPILRDLGARVLVNRWAEIRRAGAVLNIGGVYARWLRDFPAAMQQVARTIPAQGPTILLSHLPSAIWTFSGERVSLVLSGHTHGGQWRFPWIGPLWTHDKIPLRMIYGLQKVGPTQLYVTSGLGESGPIPVRFRCSPEIAVLTLQRAGKGEG
jgi:predicted MPP superfamily phosphohydrolase